MPIAPVRSRTESVQHQPEQVHLEETIRHCLDNNGYPQLWNVACRCSAGTAVLTGQVPSFYMKQIAQTIVRQVDGVEQVDDLLEVAAE